MLSADMHLAHWLKLQGCFAVQVKNTADPDSRLCPHANYRPLSIFWGVWGYWQTAHSCTLLLDHVFAPAFWSFLNTICSWKNELHVPDDILPQTAWWSCHDATAMPQLHCAMLSCYPCSQRVWRTCPNATNTVEPAKAQGSKQHHGHLCGGYPILHTHTLLTFFTLLKTWKRWNCKGTILMCIPSGLMQVFQRYPKEIADRLWQGIVAGPSKLSLGFTSIRYASSQGSSNMMSWQQRWQMMVWC